ncbi:hypothetical protein C4578_03255 [Candidatus Microgenomates bacterium]|jgi:hypothetical protein|nr:MAG: hypothetical protein C4578_03255 [Candidatus Microgenomates bacterium]
MKKIFLTILFLISLCFFSVNKAFAGDLVLSLSKLPDYRKGSSFRLYYTYFETDGKTATVNLFIQKDGKDWRQTNQKDKTTVSGYFEVGGSDFYDGEGKYHFYATAKTDEDTVTSETVSTILDSTSPGKVTDYNKERLNAASFRLKWKNPEDSDLDRVHIYRSKERSFTADSGTRVAVMHGAPGEKMIWENGVPENDIEFYYAFIAFDHAGNHSEIVTDAPGEVTPGAVLGTQTELGTGGPLTYDEETVTLPEEEETETEEEEGQLGGGISTEAGDVMGDQTEKKSKTPYFLAGLGALAVLVFSYFRFVKRNKRRIKPSKW